MVSTYESRRMSCCGQKNHQRSSSNMDEELEPQVDAIGEETKTSNKSLAVSAPSPQYDLEVGSVLQQMEEKSFVSGLHSFMKTRGSPIERIPHLGFKQINLWRIYKAAEKLGGYDAVTAQRLWKRVYDELGGSPGSTSAATCTRRHYERLVLPYERHLAGEEDKPLPPSKPRKPYKRSMVGKSSNAEAKTTLQDKDVDAEGTSKPTRQVESLPLWAPPSDRRHPDLLRSNRVSTDFCVPVYAISHNPPAASQWAFKATSDATEVISPLEKKKRMAQASLNSCEDGERPSVIRQSPVGASSARISSDGSPRPLSSSSSRSPSPFSVSSEDESGGPGEPSGPATPNNLKKASTSSEDKSPKVNKDRKDCRSQTENGPSGDTRDLPRKHGNIFYPFFVLPVRSDWTPAPSSSFTKVVPKSGPLPRPAPVHPGFISPKSSSLQDFLSGQLKGPWCPPEESRIDSKPPKPPCGQQKTPHAAGPGPTVPSGYHKPSRDFYHRPITPVLLPNNMRLPQPQIMLRHVPVNPAHAALIGPASYPYPCYLPVMSPQTTYTPPTIHPMYPYKL